MKYLALSWNGQFYISLCMTAAFIVCYLATWRPWVYMSSCTILTDYYLEQHTKSSIQELVTDYFSQSSADKTAVTILRFLTAHHPFIKRVRIFYKNAKKALIKVDSEVPFVQVAPSYIITESGRATRAEQYVPHSYEHLFCVQLHDPLALVDDCAHIYTFIKNLPAYIQENYTCTWFHKMHIILIDKQDSSVTLKIDAQTRITKKLLEAIERVKKFIKSPEYAIKLKRGLLWSIDTRCRDQLIVSQCKG